MGGWNGWMFERRTWQFHLLLALFLGWSACASEHAPVPSGQPAVETSGGTTPGPFWELRQDPDSPPRMYLLGSVHAASQDMFPLPPVIEQAYEGSDGLVVEVDLLTVEPVQMQELVTRHGLLLGKETLVDLVPPETLEDLRQVLASHDMTLEAVERMRPWMLATMLEEAELAALGYDFASGIDLYFLRRAAEEKKIAALETFDSQLTMLSNLPPELELRFLKEMLGDPEERRVKITELMAAWQRGDEAALEKALFEHAEDPQVAELYERILFRRNAAMADELERLLEGPDTWFVVVGAGHFVGDRSIIADLKKEGYDIRRVP